MDSSLISEWSSEDSGSMQKRFQEFEMERNKIKGKIENCDTSLSKKQESLDKFETENAHLKSQLLRLKKQKDSKIQSL